MPLKLLVNLLANTANAFDDSGSAFERTIENSQTVQVMKKAGRGGKRGHRLRQGGPRLDRQASRGSGLKARAMQGMLASLGTSLARGCAKYCFAAGPKSLYSRLLWLCEAVANAWISLKLYYGRR